MYDNLFAALAQAKSQPSKALRAVQSAGQAGEDVIGGYMQGKELKQKLDQYRLLSTPLGSMYNDPTQIPFGLSPSHTVHDLLTIAPAMENYIPANVAQSVFNSYSGGNGGGAPPQGPPSTLPPSTSSMNPPETPGTATLNSTEGSGPEDNGILPPGTPPTSGPPIAGHSPSSSGPTFKSPPGGMGIKAMQLIEPAMKANQERQQFQQGQAAEESRFNRSQKAEKGKAIAGQQDEITKANTRTMSGFDALNQLSTLLDKVPDNQKGAGIGQITRFGGSAVGKISPELSTYNQARHAFIGDFAAALDPNGRQNQALLNQVDSMTPTVQDDPRVVANKISAMHQFLTSQVNRNYQGYNAAANSIGGSLPRPVVPPNTYFESESDVPPNLPKGTLIHIAGRKAVVS